jgi:hypothetical protein
LPLYAFGIKRGMGSKKRAHKSGDDQCVPGDAGDFIEYGVDDSAQENYFLDELLLAQVRRCCGCRVDSAVVCVGDHD